MIRAFVLRDDRRQRHISYSKYGPKNDNVGERRSGRTIWCGPDTAFATPRAAGARL